MATVQEEPDVIVTMATQPTQDWNMTVDPVVEPPRHHPIITAPVNAMATPVNVITTETSANVPFIQQDSQYIPQPALLDIPVTAPSTAQNQVVDMNYGDFIDIRNESQENVEPQGNIPNIVFDF